MTFLNWPILIAAAAVAVPIVIHLLNRRAAKVVDWGAMHFLLGSLVSRKRRVLLDEILLLACRCLLIALLVTALARPLIPSGSSIAWAVVLPIILVAAVAFGVGTAVWKHRRVRWLCYATGAGLAALALAAVALEHVLHLGTLFGQSRDMVLVIDGSASMTIEVEGQTQFARAVDEARGLIDAIGGAATVSIVLAGPVPEVKTPVPLTDPAQLHAVLSELKPCGGMMAVHDALRTASLILSTADNATKQIVLITDGQKAGWTPGDRELWDTTAQETRTVQGRMPQVFCRVFESPGALRNAAVTELSSSRTIVGTDRPVAFRARIANGGQTAIAPSSASLSVDGKQADRRPVGRLEPAAAETVTFAWRFDSPGPHVVEVRADAQDDLPADNSRSAVVCVLDRLPVLVVNGRPDSRPLERASAFVQLALEPASAVRSQGANPNSASFVQTSVLPPDGLDSVQEWSHYRVVILADVRELPERHTKRLADFVVQGGGLMILPGPHASPPFYNRWAAAIGDDAQKVCPATMGNRADVSASKEAVHPVAGSLTFDALRPLRDSRQSDLDKSNIIGYWQLDVEPGRGTMVGGRLSDGSPWLVERCLGQGRVLVAASAFDLGDSNLPNRQAFLPLVHGLVYHLSQDVPWDLNQRPGRQVVLRLPLSEPVQSTPTGNAAAASSPPPPAPGVEVTGADGVAVDASARWEKGGLAVQFDHLSMPGVYRLHLSDAPAPLASRLAEADIPVAVPADPEETQLQWLSAEDLAKIGQSLELHPLTRSEELQAIAAGRTHGIELWKSLAFMALLCAVGEVVLTWWISLQRLPESARSVDFSNRTASAGFLEELDKLRGVQSGEAEPVTDLLEAGE